jgi:anti-sigma regulatory factor (Ser/Thr protein kinase)
VHPAPGKKGSGRVDAELTIRLQPTAGAAAEARRAVRRVCAQRQLDELADDAALCLSELVTNAVLWARTVITVAIAADRRGVSLAVHDGRPGDVPLRRDPVSNSSDRGRGLAIVRELATSAGVRSGANGKVIWCRLDVPRRRGRRPVLVPG